MSNTPAATTAASSSKSKAGGTSQAPEKRKSLFQKECKDFLHYFAANTDNKSCIFPNNDFLFYYFLILMISSAAYDVWIWR